MNLHEEGHDTYAVFFSNGILVVLEQGGIPMNQLHLKNTLNLDRLNSFTCLWDCRIWNIFIQIKIPWFFHKFQMFKNIF